MLQWVEWQVWKFYFLERPLTFYYAHGSTVPFLKEMQNEYGRLDNHHPPTIIMDIKRMLDVATADNDSRRLVKIIANVNSQSFVACWSSSQNLDLGG